MWGEKYKPKYWFYTNTKYSSLMKEDITSPGIMGLFKMEGNYDN
jgi:hypothetical protein